MSTQGQGDVAARPYAPGDAKIQIIGIIRLEDGEEYKGALLTFPAGPPDMKVLSAWDGTPFRIVPADEHDRLRTLLSSSRGEQGWRTIDSAPKDGTHIIGNTQWGAREIWWHKDTYEGEYWTDEGDSEPEPTGWIPMPSAPGSVPTSLAGQGTDDAKEDAAAAYFRSAIADGQAAVLLADLATYDNVLRELGIQESHKHPVDEVRRIQRVAETAHDQGVETAAKLIDRKVSDYKRYNSMRDCPACKGEPGNERCTTCHGFGFYFADHPVTDPTDGGAG